MTCNKFLIVAVALFVAFATLAEADEGRSYHPRFRRQFGYNPMGGMGMSSSGSQAGSSSFSSGLGGLGGMGMGGSSSSAQSFSSSNSMGGGGGMPFGFPGMGLGSSTSFASAGSSSNSAGMGR